MQSTVTTEVSPGIFQARIPVPFPLKFVNCYLVAVDGGWVMIDAGLHYPAAEEAWDRALAEIGLRPDHLKAIYLTHYHPDHFGMAGFWQQRSGAPVFMSSIEAEIAGYVWVNQDSVARHLRDFFRMYGMPTEVASGIEAQMRQIAPLTLPHPVITPLPDGDAQDTGGTMPMLESYRPLVYAGHTDGHLCLYHPDQGLFIAGDHILPKITPNISLWPQSHPDPLGAYLESLPELAHLEVSLVLPAHGPVFATYHQRIEEIQSHHADRLQRMASEAGAGRTAYEICDAIFDIQQLTPHQARFAMAETLSHLTYLVRRGRLLQEEQKGRIVFINPKSE